MNAYSRRIWWSVRPLFAWRLLRLLARAFWIAGALVVAGRLASAWFAWPVTADTWHLMGAAVFVCLFAVFALRPIALPGLARRLDQALDLHDQISTACEVSRRGPRNYVEARLLQNANDLLGQANHRFWRTLLVPWGDLEMTALVVAMWVALAVAPGLFVPPTVSLPGQPADLPPLAAESDTAMPGLPPELSQGPGPFGDQNAGGQGELSPLEAQQALDTLTDALGKQPLTESAASALAQGDAKQAAQDLRELADATRDISPEAQAQIGDSLLDASNDIGDAAPDLSERLANAAHELRSQDPAAGSDALSDVAQMIEDLNQAVNGANGTDSQLNGDGASLGGGAGRGTNGGREQAANGDTNQLQDEGDPFELPPGDTLPQDAGALGPPDHSLQPQGQRSTPFTQAGSDGGSVGQISDPLSFPWRLKSVVQRYFSSP
jgi:hypothetical protein